MGVSVESPVDSTQRRGVLPTSEADAIPDGIPSPVQICIGDIILLMLASTPARLGAWPTTSGLIQLLFHPAQHGWMLSLLHRLVILETR